MNAQTQTTSYIIQIRLPNKYIFLFYIHVFAVDQGGGIETVKNSNRMNVGVLFVHGTSDSSSAQFFNNVFEKSFNAWIENARDYCIQGVDYAAPLDLDALTMVNNVRGQDGRNM